MSLAEFQRAFGDLVASPHACASVRAGVGNLDGYDLSTRERARLAAMVRHPGMSTNCTLYRANRLGAIARGLPASCEALGSRLAAFVHGFWCAFPDADLQFRSEARRFAEFLAARLGNDPADQAIAGIVRAEIAEFEALYESERTISEE
jgi:hypothetical protein